MGNDIRNGRITLADIARGIEASVLTDFTKAHVSISEDSIEIRLVPLLAFEDGVDADQLRRDLGSVVAALTGRRDAARIDHMMRFGDWEAAEWGATACFWLEFDG